MKYARWIALLTLVAILAGCSQTPTATPTPMPTPLSQKTLFISPNDVIASGVITPAQKAQMSFTISGRVKSVNVEVGDEVKIGQMLMALDSADLDAAVAEAEAVLRGEQAMLEFRLRGNLPRKNEGPEHREIARAHVAQAEAALTAARASQAQATLVAPFEAAIVSVDVSRGEVVEAGQVVVTLGDLNHLQVETTDLSERDVPRVKVGQAAIVYIEALNEEIEGQVMRVAPQASIVEEDVVYKVVIQLKQQPAALRWGMSAEVSIIKEQ